MLAEQRRQRIENSPLGLANSLRGMGAGAQDYILDRLEVIEAPSLFLAGALDTRYAALAPVLASKVAGAEHAIIPDAGHTTHLEQPEAWSRLVRGFLDKHCAGGQSMTLIAATDAPANVVARHAAAGRGNPSGSGPETDDSERMRACKIAASAWTPPRNDNRVGVSGRHTDFINSPIYCSHS